MIGDGLLVLLGLGLLLAGAEALVRGAVGLGLLARLTPAVVGLTIVAAGTSMPELVVSLNAASRGSAGIALGNVVGSNLFNIGLVLGLTALVRPLRIRGRAVRHEWPVLLLASLVLYGLIRDRSLGRADGALLVAGLLAFTVHAVWVARRRTVQEEREEHAEGLSTASFGAVGARAWARNGLAVLVGVGLLALGSDVLVRGAVGLAATLGISDTVVGLTIVAAGTSTPELVTSLVAAWRGRDDIAVGNVLGSNIFNVFGIAGATALVDPVAVPEAIVGRDCLWMLALSALLFPLMRSGLRVTRLEGAVLVGAYAAYTAVLLAGS